MQDPKMMKAKKPKLQRPMLSPVPEDYMRGLHEGSPTFGFPSSAEKASRKGMKNDASLFYHLQGRSKSSAQIESSAVRNDYMALRRKFLLLEEESCSLGNDLRGVEDAIKSLEDEKLELLDELLVLEGLVDPSEVQNQ